MLGLAHEKARVGEYAVKMLSADRALGNLAATLRSRCGPAPCRANRDAFQTNALRRVGKHLEVAAGAAPKSSIVKGGYS